MMKRNQKGITLIALVITIIIMLILAGVSIATLTGDNGILNQVHRVKEETKIATEEEQRQLAMAEAATNFEETEYQGITIPAGFAPTRIVGESTVKEGLVTIDKNGNEWVWIEVPKSIYTNPEYQENVEGLVDGTDYEKVERVLKNYTQSYSLEGRQDKYHEGCGLTEPQYQERYQKMLKSVYANGGFWIGRYEAGIEGSTGTDEKSLTLGRSEASKGSITRKAICQKDAIPYNFISVEEAQKLASQMSTDGKWTSSLMFGIQWNLICKFLEENSNLKINDIKDNSKSLGNYIDQTFEINSGYAKGMSSDFVFSSISGFKPVDTVSILSTGASERCRILNTYDLSGNVCEVTLENFYYYEADIVYWSTRGGVVGEPESFCSMSSYGAIPSGDASSGRCFRPCMF